MRKKDYEILAAAIRRDVEKSPVAGYPMGTDEITYQTALSCSAQAQSLARYLAQYLAVDKLAFLVACGVKP